MRQTIPNSSPKKNVCDLFFSEQSPGTVRKSPEVFHVFFMRSYTVTASHVNEKNENHILRSHKKFEDCSEKKRLSKNNSHRLVMAGTIQIFFIRIFFKSQNFQRIYFFFGIVFQIFVIFFGQLYRNS